MKHSRKKIEVLSWVLGALLILFGLFFAFHLFSFTENSHRLFAKRVQKAIFREDDALQKSKIDLVTAYDQWSEAKGFQSLDSILPHDVGAYVFNKDSLVYWNNNLIEPKVLRKRVGESCDTIVNLNIGDFLITSTPHGSYSFYLFSLINTTYPVENKYFSNRFLPVLGQHKINFGAVTSPESFPVYSRANKLLSNFTIDFPTVGRSSNLPVLVLCAILMSLCLYLLVVRRVVVNRKQQKKPSNRRPLIETLLVFIVVLGAVYFCFSQVFRYGFSHGFFVPG